MAQSRIASKIVCSLFTVVTLATAGMITAGANNHTDTVYDFTFSPSGHIGFIQTTEKRPKQDASSAYMKCNTAPYSCIARVYGYNWYGENMTDCSRGTLYEFRAGTTHYMKNWVYEDGFTYAAIQARTSNESSTHSASGVWSPDSI